MPNISVTGKAITIGFAGIGLGAGIALGQAFSSRTTLIKKLALAAIASIAVSLAVGSEFSRLDSRNDTFGKYVVDTFYNGQSVLAIGLVVTSFGLLRAVIRGGKEGTKELVHAFFAGRK